MPIPKQSDLVLFSGIGHAKILDKDDGMSTIKALPNPIFKMWCRLDESKIQCGFIN